MASNGQPYQQKPIVQTHLQEVLGKLEQPTHEERLLLHQVSSVPYDLFNAAACEGNPNTLPLEGALLSCLLRNFPEHGLSATFIYAIFHALLATLTALHKHSVFHNAITAEKILIKRPDKPPPRNGFRAEDLTIHLLLFPTSSLSPTPITPSQSVPDTAAAIKLVYGLTQNHPYFIHRAADQALWAPAPWGPPYIADLADELKEEISAPRSLRVAEYLWNDYMKALLGMTTGLDDHLLEEIWHVAAYSRMERLPRWLESQIGYCGQVVNMLGVGIEDIEMWRLNNVETGADTKAQGSEWFSFPIMFGSMDWA